MRWPDTFGGRAGSKPLASAIYEGWVRHRRYAPHAHAFSYRMYMLYIDLAELDQLFDPRWLWSQRRRNVAEFRRSDYFGESAQSIDEAVRDRVARDTGQRPRGPIRMLTHLRYFGLAFNPVSFYYCYAQDGITLETILAEITNTPWKERHAYVLAVDMASRKGRSLRWDFSKAFHVSPFVPMQRDYAWRFSVPGENLCVHMDVVDHTIEGRPRELDATLVLKRHEFSGANLARVLFRYPFMTAKVIAAIHWQALRIYLRGNPFHDHPNTQEHDR
ncbi:MAG: DUF1365 domain-containing protein [Dokdonella sp.]